MAVRVPAELIELLLCFELTLGLFSLEKMLLPFREEATLNFSPILGGIIRILLVTGKDIHLSLLSFEAKLCWLGIDDAGRFF